MGRHPVGDEAMTAAERMRQYRARKREKEPPFRERMGQEEKAESRRARAREWRAQREEEGRRRWQEWRRREEARSLDPELLRVLQRQRKAQEDARKHQQVLMRKLAKVLGMLGSDHEGERAAAARRAEALRKELGVAWDDIVG